MLERPLPERGTGLRRGGGRPPEIRRPSGPKEEVFLRPPSIVVVYYWWCGGLSSVFRTPTRIKLKIMNDAEKIAGDHGALRVDLYLGIGSA